MCPIFDGSASNRFKKCQIILWACSLGCTNLWNFTWNTVKFHNCLHANICTPIAISAIVQYFSRLTWEHILESVLTSVTILIVREPSHNQANWRLISDYMPEKSLLFVLPQGKLLFLIGVESIVELLESWFTLVSFQYFCQI